MCGAGRTDPALALPPQSSVSHASSGRLARTPVPPATGDPGICLRAAATYEAFEGLDMLVDVTPEIRASDADRHAAEEALRGHYAAGRLDADELELRLSKVVGARSLSELAEVASDLPATPRARAPVRGANGAGGWGLRDFRQEHPLPTSRALAWKQLVAHIAPALAAHGYSIVEIREPNFLVFELEEASLWPWLFIGPLALLVPKRKTRVAVSLTEQGPDGTTLVAAGVARRRVRKAFAEISAD